MSPHLIALLWLLAPQAPPIHVNINVYIDNLSISESPVAEPVEAVTTTDCNALMQAINASVPAGPNDTGGQSDPFEMTAAAHQSGDACNLFPAVPTR
jgi:hypothetical protein